MGVLPKSLWARIAVMHDERSLAEAALARQDSDEGGDEEWPPVARRVKAARERADLTQSDIAERLGIDISEYWDIEFHDDEAFNVFSLTQLAQVAGILGMSVETLLFGSDPLVPQPRASFAEIARRLVALAEKERLTIDELSERIGWELKPALANPQSLGDYNVAGLRDLCRAVGIDWMTALPQATEDE